jgi:CBS domain-containing protein
MGNVSNVIQAKGDSLIFVTPETTVFQSLQLMSEKNIGALLVMDQQTLVGIFSERDYARKVVLKNKSSREIPIGEIMTENPLTVTLAHTIEDCMWLMTNRHIRHLPVVDNEKIIGIISIGDVVKYIIEEQKSIIGNLEDYINGRS